MIKFHAVMLDETRCEFGVDVEAPSKSEAYDILRRDYPESRCIQLESPEDSAERIHRMYRHIEMGGDWDDEGRPIFHYPDDADDDWDDYTDEERAEMHTRWAEQEEFRNERGK